MMEVPAMMETPEKSRIVSISMHTYCLFFFVVSFLLVHPIAAQQEESITSKEEYDALYSLRGTLGIRKYDWPRRVEPCTWRGVECRGGRVVSLNFTGFPRKSSVLKNPKFAVDGLQNLTMLEKLISVGFSLSGPLPEWFGTRLAPSISVLDLQQSNINGTIPVNIGNLKNLTRFLLSNNSLGGSIPPSFQNLSLLETLDLSFNNFTGSISDAKFENLRALQFLSVRSNQIEGTILRNIGDLTQLDHLDFGNNKLDGEIPSEIGTLNRLKFLDLSNNSFRGELPNSTWDLDILAFLDVSNNNFTGNLSSIDFSSIATNTNTSDRLTFDLSANSFFGVISESMIGLSQRLNSLRLSDNYFQGRLPFGSDSIYIESNCLFAGSTSSVQKSDSVCAEFYLSVGERYLGRNDEIPGSQPPPPPSPSNNPPSDGISRRNLIFIFVGVSAIVILFLILLIICLMKRRNRSYTSQSQTTLPASSYVSRQEASSTVYSPIAKPSIPPPTVVGDSFTYEQLSHSTSNFNGNNLIKHGHSGSFYRGVLENGSVIVVKKFKSEQRYQKEFEFLSRVMHSRLVPFVGHCSDDRFQKLLVYKHMDFGDLSTAFYRKSLPESANGLQSLDWITRMKIAIGVAEALCYLHNDCDPPFVHRDVQATSILLDDNFEVRLGSLSEVCIQEGSSRLDVVTRFFRLHGSSEPNPSSNGNLSGTAAATCAHDVYCFGKVLLELVTGNIGISGATEEKANQTLEETMPCINIKEKELLNNIIDPSLIVEEDLMEEVWAMAIIAKSCLNSKPKQRPLVNYVLKALENPLKFVREDDKIHSDTASLHSMSSARRAESWTNPAAAPPALVLAAQENSYQTNQRDFAHTDVHAHASLSLGKQPKKEISFESEKLQDK